MKTYTVPELLLVGAAQQLVLQGCDIPLDSRDQQASPAISCGSDGPGTREYDVTPF